MFARILKAGMLVLAAAMTLSLALPAAAADRHGGFVLHSRGNHGLYAGNHSGFRRHFDSGRRPQFAAHNRVWNGRPDFRHNGFNNNNGFAWNDSGRGYGRRPFGPDRLRRFSSSRDIITRRGSGVTAILNNRPDYDVISNNYAGANDVYQADGGTYVTGYGYADDRAGRASGLRPKAKIIDVARAGDPCSHENGVCVIRP